MPAAGALADPRAGAGRTSPWLARAEEALDLVGSDPRTALATAEQVAAAAQRDRDAAAASVAHRAAGLALRELGDLLAAERRCRTAVRVAARGAAGQATAQARMSLAFILLERGRVRAALTAADAAAAVLRGQAAARLHSQRALILQRAGRFDEALAAFGQALPVLRRCEDALWEARALNNRGLLYAYQGALGAAEADLSRARQLHHGLGLDKFAADVDWNLGFVAARRGDAVAALARFDAAESALARHGSVHPQLLLDRCEVLLAVGLADEARRTAIRAVESLRAAGQHADRAEGWVLLARARAAAGDPARAREAARAARLDFHRQGRSGWALLAGFFELRAAELAGRPTGGLLRASLSCADELVQAGWRATELDARLTAASVATHLGDVPLARQQLGLAAAARGAGSLDVRTRAWYATAMLRAAGADRRGALAAARAGLAVVERHQADLGATEFRVHVAGYGVRLAQLGLSLAIGGGDPRSVLAWAERVRARSLRLPPARPPDEADLAEALAEVRRLGAALLRARLAGANTAGLARRHRTAEQRVVHASRTARSALHRPPAPPPTTGQLAAALGDAALVEYVVHAGELLAVTLRERRCRLHRLGPVAEVAARIEAAHFALRRLALGFGTARSAGLVHAAAVTVGRELDRLLLLPLRAEVADRPVVIVPTGDLHPVPWGMLPSLAGRPVRVAPSAATWLRVAGMPAADPAGSIVFAAGPGLPAAREEVRVLARDYGVADPLVDERAEAATVLAALDGAGLAHIAAHGRLRVDNPLFSSLELADGPLTVYDLERLGQAPRAVVLPACQSGVTAVRVGDELLGLTSALLTLGARTVVAAVSPVRDAATTPFMRELHQRLRRGEPPAAALAGARAAAAAGEPSGWAAAAAFTCFGA